MTMLRPRAMCRFCLLVLSLVLFTHTAPAQFIGPVPGTNPAAVASPPPTFTGTTTLLPGDLIELRIFNINSYDFKGRVADDGTIAIPLVGTLQLGNVTIAAAEQAAAQRLIAGDLVKQPQIDILVLESPAHVATVSGEVKAPGSVPIFGEKRLLDVLSAVGGLTPASSPSISIYRHGAEQPFQVVIPADASASGSYNIVIVPGDNIVVGKVGIVYVVGALHSQGAIPLKSTTPLTLIQAMSLAGGVNYEAALNKAYILRATSTGRQEIGFNVKDVLHHHAPDLPLQNDDIVLIPTNDLKAALKGGAAGVASSLVAGIGYIYVNR